MVHTTCCFCFQACFTQWQLTVPLLVTAVHGVSSALDVNRSGLQRSSSSCWCSNRKSNRSALKLPHWGFRVARSSEYIKLSRKNWQSLAEEVADDPDCQVQFVETITSMMALSCSASNLTILSTILQTLMLMKYGCKSCDEVMKSPLRFLPFRCILCHA